MDSRSVPCLPSNLQPLFASAWHRRRRPWNLQRRGSRLLLTAPMRPGKTGGWCLPVQIGRGRADQKAEEPSEQQQQEALGSDEAHADGEEVRCFVEGGKGTHDLGVDLRWCPDLHSAEKGREVVLVHAVQEGGSCALAGLIVGDEIRRLNDTPLQVRT